MQSWQRLLLTDGTSLVHDLVVALKIVGAADCGCSSVVEHLLAKERVESSNLFIRLIQNSDFDFWRLR